METPRMGSYGMQQMLERFRRNVKEQIRRYKKKTKWNWPELHLYCGICDLKTGLYIRSAVSVLVYIVILAINLAILYYLLVTGTKLYSMDLSDIEEYLGISFTEVKAERVKKIYNAIVVYMLFWILFKIFYITGGFLTIYAIYKKKPKILKVVYYINILNWTLDILISIFGAIILQLMSRTLVIICVLFEGYNLMAINSEYKQLKGKSKLIINMNNVDVGTDITPVEEAPPSAFFNRKHCETCACYDEPSGNVCIYGGTADGNAPVDTSSTPDQEDRLDANAEKVFNIKDVDTIFNQDLLVPGQSAVSCVNEVFVCAADGRRAVRPQTLRLPPYPEEKIDIADIPTIYDEDQLHVGGSPVVDHMLGDSGIHPGIRT